MLTRHLDPLQPKLVPVIMPFVAPFIFLLHQIWPSEDYIRQLPATMPTLFLSGDDDELVPPSHVKELYRICPSEKKELRTFEFGSHSTFPRSHFRRRLARENLTRPLALRRHLCSARVLYDYRCLHLPAHRFLSRTTINTRRQF